MESKIGKRYARALLNLASKENKVEEIGAELNNLANLYAEDPALHNFIEEPKYNKSLKVKTIAEIIAKLGYSKLFMVFCKFLITKNRFMLLGYINRAYNSISNEMLGCAAATILVASELSEQEKKTLQQNLTSYTGKTIDLTVTVDPAIIGGAITSIGSLVLDGSIRNRMNLIRESLYKGN